MAKAVSKKVSSKKALPKADAGDDVTVAGVLAQLEALASPKVREGLRGYGIFVDQAYGIPMNQIQGVAKAMKKLPSERRHRLALELWDTGWYEARAVACYLDDPARVTAAQMDRWCRDFDNWGTCDTVCFALFDRSPHAWSRIEPWSRKKDEFEKRGAFALLACLALHDKAAPDDRFLRLLPIVEEGGADGRNSVKKAILWALRAIGGRNARLRSEALAVADRLAASPEPGPRWVGKSTIRELSRKL